MARFTDFLRLQADDVWQAQHAHPFVRGIGDGTLDPEKFGHWLRQDYLFLTEYARLSGAAVLRAPGLEDMRVFSQLLYEILGREMELHKSYCAEFGIGADDLARGVMTPTTQAYTDFLLRAATTRDWAELLGALLPCMWGYSEVGTQLAQRGMPADPRFRRWINVYADPEFGEIATWCRDLLDAACEGLPNHRLAVVERQFLTSSRYELQFWEMAWTLETWRV